MNKKIHFYFIKYALYHLVFSFSLFWVSASFANDLTFIVQYDKNHTDNITIPSLKNATLYLQIYMGGKSVGKETVITDEKQGFSLNGRYEKQYGKIFRMSVSLKNSSDNIRCHGIITGNQTVVYLNCHKKPERHSY